MRRVHPLPSYNPPVNTTPVEASRPIDRVAMVAGPLVVLALIGWFAGWTGPDQPHGGADTARVLLTSAPWAIGWLAAAIGYGWPLRRLLVGESRDALAIQAGLGVAAMLFLDAALGAIGVLQLGGSIGAWVLLLAGAALLAEQLRRWMITTDRVIHPMHWLTWTAAGAIAVLLVSACSAPGWLWASEFGGYDALSYHLQLPKEWLALGRIEPLNHNVYSYLPGYVEAAYYHLAVLRGDGIEAVYACQLLHVGFTLLAAVVAGRFAARLGGPIVGAAASVVILGTPWVIVVGSLAYNEMAVALMLATGLLIASERRSDSWRFGAMMGIVAATACGAKLTAAGFVAVPLGLVMLLSVPPRRWRRQIIAACAAGLIVLLPYLVRNWAYAGNPIFPFATGVLGLGHWTQQQADIWNAGHTICGSAMHRLAEAWNQFLRYGIGPSPYPDEPWAPQWSILPWLTALGIAAGCASPRLRRITIQIAVVLIAQLAFWLIFTHIKSRFMLPAAVPAALGVGIGLGAVIDRLRTTPAKPVLAAALGAIAIAWCCVPIVVFRHERDGAPAHHVGWVDVITGDGLSSSQRRELADHSPIIMINHILPADAKVLLVGDATPLYYRRDVVYQTTWDRGPLSRLMRQEGDDAWLNGLSEQGFTHLLVEPTMLEVWEDSLWNDPNLTASRVINAAERFADLEQSYPSSVRFYRLR